MTESVDARCVLRDAVYRLELWKSDIHTARGLFTTFSETASGGAGVIALSALRKFIARYAVDPARLTALVDVILDEILELIEEESETPAPA